MKKQTMALTVLLLSLAATQANAADCDSRQLDECDVASTYTALTTFAPSTMLQLTTEGEYSKHNKLIAAAREDAQVYVASDGQIYGVQFAAAVAVLRADIPHLAQADDMQIARAIIGQ